MLNLLQDVRYALRLLRKSPGFTVVAILTLALGIGANTAIFTVVNTVLLRSLPYKQSSQLVKVWGKYEKQGIPRNWISEPEWWDLKNINQSFSDVAAYSGGDGANLILGGAEPVRVRRSSTSASFFPMLGAQLQLGRFYSADEDQPGRSHVVVLTYGMWKSSLAADPAVVGKQVQLDGESYTVIGVLAPRFSFGDPADIWTPLALDKAKPQNRGSHYLEVIGRLKPQVSLTQAGLDMQSFADQLMRGYPDNYPSDSGFGLSVVPLQLEVTGEIRPALLVLLAAVAFVLLIACANLANLLLARASVRQREIGIRVALGASSGRLLRQLMTESLILALAGGAAGVLLAYLGVDLFRNFGNLSIPRADELSIDGWVLIFAFAVSVLTGLIFGLAPALHAVGKRVLMNALKEGGRGTSSGVTGNRLRANLVSLQIAVALVLLVGAGLLLRSFQHLLAVDPGFRPDHLLTMRLSLPRAKYPKGPASSIFYKNLVERVQALPGVQAAGTVTNLPLSGANSSGSVLLEDVSAKNATIYKKFNAPILETDNRWITRGYLDAMQVPLLRGRKFTPADERAEAPLVALVDDDFVKHFWPDKDPIGQRIAYDAVKDSQPPVLNWRTIVGIVGHVKHYGLDVKGREQAYFPEAQDPGPLRDMFLVVRTGNDPASIMSAIRGQVASLDSELPIYSVETMDELRSTSMAQRQLNIVLLLCFSVLALVLAAVGIYGVMSFSVTQRTNEIGIRMALGASPYTVLKMILSKAVRLAAVGLAAGLVLAFMLTRLMVGLLFGVGAADPVTYIAIAALLALVAFLASLVPAIRATKVDPMVALRYE
jgi:putative ABC transport system permease protein